MSKEEMKSYSTLRGFLNGEEKDEPIYFKYSATLRIHGESLPFDEIAEKLKLLPTSFHRKGDRQGPRSPEFRNDAWHYEPGLPESEPLFRHIEELWKVLKPHVDYLKTLKKNYTVDVFCGYRSNCDHAGIEVPHSCLEIFTALEIPFGVSIIIA
jgi:hypothetical protein